MKKLLLILFFLLLASPVFATVTMTQSMTTIGTDLGGGFVYGSQESWAHSFQVQNTDEIVKFTWMLKKVNANQGTITGYIYSDTGGLPNAVVATFSNIDYDDLTTSFAEYEFTGTFTPTADTTYHMVLDWTGGNVTGLSDMVTYLFNSNVYALGNVNFYTTAWVDYNTAKDYETYFKLYQDDGVTAGYGQTIIMGE